MYLQLFETKNSKIEYLLKSKERASTLLFVHGLGMNIEQFLEQIAFFKNSYQVLAINVNGHGNSNSNLNFSLLNCAIDILDLTRELEINSFHFIGSSMGGNIGYEILKIAPDHMLSFTSFGTTAELRKSRLAVIVVNVFRLFSNNLIATIASFSGQTPLSKLIIKRITKKINKQAVIDIMLTLSKFNYCEVISKSQCPALIIKGAKDKSINKTLKKTILTYEKRGNFRLEVFKNSGHFANLDNSNEFNNTLLSFIESIQKVQVSKKGP